MARVCLVLTLIGLITLLGASCTSKPAVSTFVVDDIAVLPALQELVPGMNRLSFGVFDKDGNLLELNTATVKMFYLEGDKSTPKGQYQATYYKMHIGIPDVHPDGTSETHTEVRGFYLVPQVNFDKVGVWQAQITAVVNGTPKTAPLVLQVVNKTDTPAVGAPAPASKNLTVRDVKDISELTSRTPPEPLFHQVSVSEALQAHRPFVVTFSTPSFCVSRMCGPVLEIVRSIAVQTKNVDFIQIEPYDLALARSKGQLQLVPAAQQWGLHSEPWVFVVDTQGKISAKFEGLLTPEELLIAVQRVTQ